MEFDDDDEKLAFEREYGWQVKLKIYDKVESMWQAYMTKGLNYPETSFAKYIIKNKLSKSLNGAGYLIWVWKLIKRYKFTSN